MIHPAHPDGSRRGPGEGQPKRPGVPVGWGEDATSTAVFTSPVPTAARPEMLPWPCRQECR